MTQQIFNALQAGRAEDAELRCREMLADSPDDPDVLLFLALALHQQNKLGEAIAIYARLTEMFPDSATHWGNYATSLRGAGRFAEAAAASDKSLSLVPDDAEQWINRGLLQLQQRDFVAARESLFTALRLAPQSPSAHIYAARACMVCRDHRAEELTKDWRAWLPLDFGLQLELADLKLLLGEADSAQWLLEDLNVRYATSIVVQLALAGVYERVNRLDAAQLLIDRLKLGGNELTEGYQRDLDRLAAALALRQGQYDVARRLLEKAGPRHEHDYDHFFVLAEVLDKLGLPSGALQALSTAHGLQRAELVLTVPGRLEPGAPVLPAAVGRISPENYRQWPKISAPALEDSPIFIVGFPRSGTTLLEQMLDAHPALQSMDERPFFNLLADQLADHGFSVPADLGKLDQHACDELRKGYLSMVCSKIARRWDARLVDKNPLNMLWLPMIHRLFPRAKFILALRHPCDVVISNYMQNYRASVLAAASTSIDRLASAYVIAMECWLHHVEVLKPDVLVSRYEELVVDPVRQTQRIAGFLGLDDAAPLLSFDRHAREKGYIATPSYTQVIQPVNRKGLNRWRRYREALAPALPILQPMLEHWDYSLDEDP